MTVSHDGGLSWRARAQPLYVAGNAFENGCWEPGGVQLRDGAVLVFFANESPFRASDEQEITLLRSNDRAQTWGPPLRFSFRAGKRDGMPIPLLLQSGALVVAIEDNGLTSGDKLQPAILRGDDIRDGDASSIDGDDPRRYPAIIDLPAGTYAGAPFIRQLPGGQTLLACQSDEGRSQPHMVVYLGDADARNFAGRSIPFALPDHAAGKWNALFVKDRSTVVALTTARIDGRWGIWAVDGRIVPVGGR
jgi:hypothetical protein